MMVSGSVMAMGTGILLWIGTYLVHSTVIIAGVWALTSLVPKLSLATKETLWRVALFGGVLTSSVQLAASVQPPWGPLSLPAETAPAARDMAAAPEAPSPEPEVVQHHITQHRSGDLLIETVRERRVAPEPVVTAAPTPPSEVSHTLPWAPIVLGVLGAGMLLALGRLGHAAIRLRRDLRDRRDVIEDPVLETFLALCQKAELGKRVRLTASSKLSSPVALASREIVLPERAIEGLSVQQHEGMLAHELAHLIRRDPWWSWGTAIFQAIFFFQPLNHVARTKIREVAEFQCDDWAARHVGTGVHLAKCLAEVARWMEQSSEGSSSMMVAMAENGSPIVRRITRLLDDRRRRRERPAHAAGRIALGVGVLGAAVGLAPAITLAAGSSAEEADPGDTVPQLASAMESDRDVRFHDVRGEDGIDRSSVELQAGDERIRVQIARPRTPEPPPPPESHGMHIIVGGHISGWGWGDVFTSWLWLEVGGLEALERDLEGLERELQGLEREVERDLPWGFRRMSDDRNRGAWQPGSRTDSVHPGGRSRTIYDL